MKWTIPLLLPTLLAALTACSPEETAVSGWILDRAGLPIAGATVDLHGFGYYLAGEPEDSMQTGEDGAFSLSYEEQCGFVHCLGGGHIVADAAGFEAQTLRVVENADPDVYANITLTLTPYDELSVEETGIPDEQPRRTTEATTVSSITPALPDVADATAQLYVTKAVGSCSHHIPNHGRLDEFSCTADSGETYRLCFAIDAPGENDATPNGSAVCYPDRYGGARIPKTHLTLSAPLPPVDIDTIPEHPLPLFIGFKAGSENDYVTCSWTPDNLFTNSGEPVPYECRSTPVTWLLGTLTTGDVWLATRVGSQTPPADGVLNVLGRRQVPLDYVRF